MRCVKLILMSCIGIVASRPQVQQNIETRSEGAEPQVEIERQLIHEVIPLSNDNGPPSNYHLSQRKVEDSTREILEKIAEVNKKQGLVEKKPKPNYFHFPFSYSRSQGDDQQSNNFKFSRDPFSNPILEYFENNGQKNNKNKEMPSFRRPNFESGGQQPEGFGLTDTNPEITPEENIPGQYIKRKITHYQSVLMPNPYMLNNMFNVGHSAAPLLSPEMASYAQPNAQFSFNNHIYPNKQYGSPIYSNPGSIIPVTPPKSEEAKKQTTLENETINNIKGIVTESQEFQRPLSPNYNSQTPEYNTDFQNINFNQQPYLKQQLYQGLPVSSNGVLGNNPNKKYLSTGDQNNYLLNTAGMLHQTNKARQNWNWPGANMFPIYIRDPFLQMYYAVTNMIEYGPMAGNEGPCKLTPRPTRIKPNSKTTPDIGNSGHQVTLEMNKREGIDKINIKEIDESDLTYDPYLDVENIDVGDDDLVKFTINLPKSTASGSRELKDEIKSEKMGWEFIKSRNDTRLSHLASGKLDFTSQPLLEPKHSPPMREPILQIDELEDESLESEKAEDIKVDNQNSKKVFSKDNTGNGIFIQKLKVRKGGVAIAGPGGIATAGSGGTAIVGPNGIAYTHPNGLAIAGSGTKVVAVDPTIDLNDVIRDTVLNGTHHIPNTRLGKVVAVGPVVYYNRG